MANEVIGHSVCPSCALERLMDRKPLSGLPLQEVRLSEKSKKPYITCDECGSQNFARQPGSVNVYRRAAGHDWGLPKPEVAARPEQVAAPAPSPKPAQSPAQNPKPTPPAAKEPQAEESTIFDALINFGKKKSE